MKRFFIMLALSFAVAQTAHAQVETTSAPSCDVIATIDRVQAEYASTSLEVGTIEYPYTELRGTRTEKFTDPERQILLALLNVDTCLVQTVTITKHGDQLLVPSQYTIDAIRRPSGIRWNAWNTLYAVEKPSEWFVIGLVYPHVKDEKVTKLVHAASGKIIRTTTKKRTITNVFYVPYTDHFDTQLFIHAGQQYQQDLTSRAVAWLHDHRIDLHVPSDYAERLLMIEHMDDTEFILDPEWTANMVAVGIGANRDNFSAYTCSPAGACGPRQWTPGTWKDMVKAFPNAHLPMDFVTGARDPFWSMVASLLLHENNLFALKTKLTKAEYAALIADPHLLEGALDAAYNTGVPRTVAVLKAYLAHPDRYTHWYEAKGRGLKGHFVGETKGYEAKLEYIRDEWPSRTMAQKN